MTKQEMICPKAKECKQKCPAKKAHKEMGACVGFGKCPACIPVEPCTDSRSLEDIEQCCGDTSQMPLIKLPNDYVEFEAFNKGAEQQRDADMAWHKA